MTRELYLYAFSLSGFLVRQDLTGLDLLVMGRNRVREGPQERPHLSLHILSSLSANLNGTGQE